MKTIMRLILTSILLLPQLIEAQPATWTPRGIGSGGAIQNPTISPFNGNRVYLSCDMSQMFETTDFGATWNIQNHSKIQGGIRGKVVYTNDPLKLYAISASSSGAYVPKKSLDGGNTWSNFSNNPCVNFGAFQIYSNPSDFNQFVISDKKNIYFTNNGGTSFVTIDTDNSTPGIHLAGVFFEGQNIYISSNKKMFKSTDGGLSFPAGNALTYSNANILSTEGVVSFTGAKENGITKFFCSTISASNLTCRTYGSDVTFFVGLYELTAPFTSWSNITGSLSNSNASDVEKAYYVTMLPTDIDTLYIGGAVASGGSNYGTVFRSTNSGVNWTNQFLNNTKAINNTDIYTGWVGNSSTAGYTHGWVSINTVEGLAIDPNDVNRIIMTDKSAAHYSTDGGTIWHQMYVQPSDENPSNQTFSASKQYATSGLETTVTYWLTWIDQQNMIASCADITAIKSSNAGQKWSYDYSTTNIYAAAPLRINDVSMIIKHPSTGVLYASTGDVAARTIRYPIGKRVRYTQTLKAQGWQAEFELLHILEMSADLAISRGLEISCGERVALVERLGFANEEPISVCSGYFPLKRFPDFFEPSHLQILETEKSISRFLYQVYGCDHIRRSTAVSARLVQPQDAILLQLSDNQPILLAESVNVDQGGNVIEYGVTRFRGDRMELFFENDLTQCDYKG